MNIKIPNRVNIKKKKPLLSIDRSNHTGLSYIDIWLRYIEIIVYHSDTLVLLLY